MTATGGRAPNCPDRESHAAALEHDVRGWVEDTVIADVWMLAAHDRDRARRVLVHMIGLLEDGLGDEWSTMGGPPPDIEDPDVDPCIIDSVYYLGPQPSQYELATAARRLLATRVTGWAAAVRGRESLGRLVREARDLGYMLVGRAELNGLARFTPTQR